MLPDLLRAVVELGLPVTALSWLLFYRLFHRGELARDADRKAIRSGLKQIKGETRRSETPSDSVLHRKWMRFGGGFYGTAALWTLIVIEAAGIAGAVAEPSSVEHLFDDGLVGFLVNLVVNQFSAFLQAILWFNWWGGKGYNAVVWMAVAYAGYYAGLALARRESEIGSRVVGLDWRSRLRAWIGGDRE